MREFYELDDLYPERYKLKEKGVDIEAWYDELFDDKGNFKENQEIVTGVRRRSTKEGGD